MSVLDKIFSRPPAKADVPLHIVEGVEGMFSYHLSQPGSPQALCNPQRTMMRTGLPLRSWGFRGHLHEKYCATCARLTRDLDLGHLLPPAPAVPVVA